MNLNDLLAIQDTAAQISSLGMQIASDKNGRTNVKKSKELYDYQLERNLKYNQDINENLTKPYYQYQLLNGARLNVEGLKAAGINPLMVYGSNTGIQGADSITSEPSGDIGANLSAFQSQTDTSISAALAGADIAKKLAETKSINKDVEQKNSFNEFARQLYDGEARTAQGNAILTDTEIKYKRADIKRIQATLTNLDAQTRNLDQSTQNLVETYSLLKKQGKLTDAQIDNVISDTAVNMAKSIRETFGLNLDQQQLRNLKQSLQLMVIQGNALAPANAIAKYLQQGNNANIYAQSWLNEQKGIGNIQFGLGEQNNITTMIKSGHFLGLAKSAYDDATKDVPEHLKPIYGSAAVGQQIVNLITTNIGSLLGQLAGFVGK